VRVADFTFVELYSDRFAVLTLDDGVVVYRRTAVPYRTIDEARGALEALRAALPAAAQGLVLLLDARDAVGRNDPEFEGLLLEYRKILFTPFRKTAVLVRTAAGALQTARLEKTERLGAVEVFLDEAEALGFLRR
jgi:hypothetical protein